MHLIWVSREQKYFLKWGWTGDLQNSPSGKSVGLSPVAKAAGVSGRFRIRDWRRMGTTVSSRNDDYAIVRSQGKVDLIQRQADVRCSLLIADDTGGTIWRIAYTGPKQHLGTRSGRGSTSVSG
jgi:hypothetical protein